MAGGVFRQGATGKVADMRIMLLAAIAIAALISDISPSAAVEGPWCSQVTLGRGKVATNCSYRSFEECYPNVIAGNRGFCSPNPYWSGVRGGAARPKAHHKRRVKRD
jgi:hypothetical protein